MKKKGRKEIVSNKEDLARLILKTAKGDLESKTIKALIKTVIETIVELETAIQIRGYKSCLQVLRKESSDRADIILNGKYTKRGHSDVLSGL